MELRPLGRVVKSLPFHGKDVGSIPSEVISEKRKTGTSFSEPKCLRNAGGVHHWSIGKDSCLPSRRDGFDSRMVLKN